MPFFITSPLYLFSSPPPFLPAVSVSTHAHAGDFFLSRGGGAAGAAVGASFNDAGGSGSTQRFVGRHPPQSHPRGILPQYGRHWGIYGDNDVSSGPLACPFARLLAPLTQSLAQPCSLGLRAPLRSFTHFLAHGKVNDSISPHDLFCPIVRWTG